MSIALFFISFILPALCKVNVHIIPHTHDDPGWLKTVDEYYLGTNTSIFRAGVQYVLDTVMQALAQDKRRKFVYVEMSFFQRWYAEQTQPTRSLVKQLVKNGQLSFANGGWSMHDEATSHFVSMIDQTTLGHRFLQREFGFLPTVGWQIDPFGHSATNAALLSAEIGFDSLFFGRIDYEDLVLRRTQRRLEFVWRGSVSLSEAQVFTGVFSDGNYQPPAGFCFDASCSDDPIVTDPALDGYNADSAVERFHRAILSEMAVTKGDNIAFKMGSDFHYSNAHMWYKNLDKIIALTNERLGDIYNVFYSTPAEFTLAKHAEGLQWSVKTDDFFPYADCAHCYWTGYFTSRPTLKLLERRSSSFLQILKQLLTTHHASDTLYSQYAQPYSQPEADRNADASPLMHPADPVSSSPLFRLTAALGLVNHHDAVTGTSKQHVADDYTKILSAALTSAEAAASAAVEWALRRALERVPRESRPKGEYVQKEEILPVLGKVTTCRLSNESVCDVTQSLSTYGTGEAVLVVAYNPLPRTRSQVIQVLLGSAAVAPGVSVYVTTGPSRVSANREEDIHQVNVYAELLPPFVPPNAINKTRESETYTLVFLAEDISALSTRQYLVQLRNKQETNSDESLPARVLVEDSCVSNPALTSTSTAGTTELLFDCSSGLLTHLTVKAGVHSSSSDLKQDFAYYVAFGDQHAGSRAKDTSLPASPTDLKNSPPNHSLAGVDPSDQPSGAYIFRPIEQRGIPISSPSSGPVFLKMVHGKLVSEARQVYSDWVSQTIRITTHVSTSISANDDVETPSAQAEVSLRWLVGPVPVGDGRGREVVMRIQSDVANRNNKKTVMYTDGNGREFQRRVLNHRDTWNMTVTEPVAGNYYPVTAAAYIQTETQNGIEGGHGVRLSVLPDRAQGCASLWEGHLECMVHRRLVVDDRRGVGEALNETAGGMTGYPTWQRSGPGVTVGGSSRLLLSPRSTSTAGESPADRDVRIAMDQQFNPLALFFAPISTQPAHSPAIATLLSPSSNLPSPIGTDLGPIVQLVTLERWTWAGAGGAEDVHHAAGSRVNTYSYLLRLGHAFAEGEDENMAAPAKVDIRALLNPLIAPYASVSTDISPKTTLATITEMSLSANQPREDMLRKKLRWVTDGDSTSLQRRLRTYQKIGASYGDGGDPWIVTLQPMEVRTFLVCVPRTQAETEESLSTYNISSLFKFKKLAN